MTSLRLAQWWWFTRQLPQPKSGLFTRDIVWARIILIGSSNPSCPVGDNNRPEGLLHHAKSLLGDIWATRLPPRIANYTFLWPRHMRASIHHPCTNHSAPSISVQTDWAWMLRNTFCPVCSTREDFFLLWDRKIIGVGSICHSCHQSQRVKVTACLAGSTSLQIPVSTAGLFLRWYQRQCVSDEAITGLSRFILLSWCIKNSSSVLKVTIYQ